MLCLKSKLKSYVTSNAGYFLALRTFKLQGILMEQTPVISI